MHVPHLLQRLRPLNPAHGPMTAARLSKAFWWSFAIYLGWALALVMVFAPQGWSRAQDLAKALTPVVLALPAAYFAYCFQLNRDYQRAMTLWRTDALHLAERLPPLIRDSADESTTRQVVRTVRQDARDLLGRMRTINLSSRVRWVLLLIVQAATKFIDASHGTIVPGRLRGHNVPSANEWRKYQARRLARLADHLLRYLEVERPGGETSAGPALSYQSPAQHCEFQQRELLRLTVQARQIGNGPEWVKEYDALKFYERATELLQQVGPSHEERFSAEAAVLNPTRLLMNPLVPHQPIDGREFLLGLAPHIERAAARLTPNDFLET